MEKHSMLMVRKNQYRENCHTAYCPKLFVESVLSHQVTIDFLQNRKKKKKLKLHIEPKECLHTQDNPKKKNPKLETSCYLTSNDTTKLQ